MRIPLLARSCFLAVTGVALSTLVASTALYADDHDHSDQDRARQALERGQVLSLRAVLDQVERQYQGQVLKVEFERDDARFIYEIRLLQKDGRVVKLKVDAVDGKVLDVKRKEH